MVSEGLRVISSQDARGARGMARGGGGLDNVSAHGDSPGNILFEELWAFKDRLREDMLRHTRRAFRMLPKMERPRILDIGCGSGVPTLELERLSCGKLTAVDTDQVQLDRLAKKVEEAGLSGRIKVMRRSMLDLDFPEQSFDIVWAEGSIAVIGFERGLREWRRLIREGGHLVVHDDLRGLHEKLKLIPRCGYELIGHFLLGVDTWWREYYSLLEKELETMRAKYGGDGKTAEILECDQKEVDGFHKEKNRYRSVFYVIRK
jgi:SAM-dependent methyltransferase